MEEAQRESSSALSSFLGLSYRKKKDRVSTARREIQELKQAILDRHKANGNGKGITNEETKKYTTYPPKYRSP